MIVATQRTIGALPCNVLAAPRGETILFHLSNVKDADGAAVADISDWTFSFELAEEPFGTPFLTLATGSGITQGTDSAAWQVATAAIASPAFFRTKATSPQGTAATLELGIIHLTPAAL